MISQITEVMQTFL